MACNSNKKGYEGYLFNDIILYDRNNILKFKNCKKCYELEISDDYQKC